jgi:hypothetical protein
MAEAETGETGWGDMRAYADQAIQLREFASLSEHDLAAVTGADVDAVRAWLDGRAAPTRPQADRLVELAVIVQRLARAMRPEAIPGWLNAPVPVLDGRRPLQLIASGDYERVARVVSSFESPVFT